MEADMFAAMRNSILDGDEALAAELAEAALAENLDPDAVMNEGFLKGIQEVGNLFQTGEYFLPELVCAADAMKAALEILTPALNKALGCAGISKGSVMIATVEGDVHDIGKKIVAAMLTAAGYDVFDLGVDVPSESIVQAVSERQPDVLGMSAMLTTTMQEQKNVISMLEKENLKDHVKVIIGGAPVSNRWAGLIRADGYSDSATDAVKLVAKLLG